MKISRCLGVVAVIILVALSVPRSRVHADQKELWKDGKYNGWCPGSKFAGDWAAYSNGYCGFIWHDTPVLASNEMGSVFYRGGPEKFYAVFVGEAGVYVIPAQMKPVVKCLHIDRKGSGQSEWHGKDRFIWAFGRTNTGCDWLRHGVSSGDVHHYADHTLSKPPLMDWFRKEPGATRTKILAWPSRAYENHRIFYNIDVDGDGLKDIVFYGPRQIFTYESAEGTRRGADIFFTKRKTIDR